MWNSLSEVEWDYRDMNQWKVDLDLMKTLKITGKGAQVIKNRRKFALFYAKTLDRMADPEL